MSVTVPARGIEVAHHARASRFEALEGGRRVGLVEYRLQGAAAVFAHTEVVCSDGSGSAASRVTPGRFEHVATPLIAAALDQTCARGYYVVALCPYVRAFVDAHPGYRASADARFLA